MGACKECKVGPGKFEGEGAAAPILYAMVLDGCGDESASNDNGGGSAELFRGPIDSVDPTIIEFAHERGFCRPCLAAAVKELETCAGAIVEENSQGFVSCRVFESDEKEAMDAAWQGALIDYGDGYDGSEEVPGD